MDLKIVVTDPALIPERMHPGDAGLDLKTNCDIDLRAHEQLNVFTGVKVEIPCGYAGLVVGRSGMAFQYGVSLVNGISVVDAGYSGEIGLPLINHGDFSFTAKKGDRIAQLLIIPCELVDLVLVDSLDETERGEGGFGSTGA
jgi:dUTP pyrophosphatase